MDNLHYVTQYFKIKFFVSRRIHIKKVCLIYFESNQLKNIQVKNILRKYQVHLKILSKIIPNIKPLIKQDYFLFLFGLLPSLNPYFDRFLYLATTGSYNV